MPYLHQIKVAEAAVVVFVVVAAVAVGSECEKMRRMMMGLEAGGVVVVVATVVHLVVVVVVERGMKKKRKGIVALGVLILLLGWLARRQSTMVSELLECAQTPPCPLSKILDFLIVSVPPLTTTTSSDVNPSVQESISTVAESI